MERYALINHSAKHTAVCSLEMRTCLRVALVVLNILNWIHVIKKVRLQCEREASQLVLQTLQMYKGTLFFLKVCNRGMLQGEHDDRKPRAPRLLVESRQRHC